MYMYSVYKVYYRGAAAPNKETDSHTDKYYCFGSKISFEFGPLLGSPFIVLWIYPTDSTKQLRHTGQGPLKRYSDQ